MIPIVDMQLYLNGNPEDKQDFTRTIHAACRDTGFFYLKNHSISPIVMKQMLDLTRFFFQLPQDIKDNIDIKYSKCCRGYGRLQAEKTHGIGDYKETYDLGPERQLHPERAQKPYLSLLGPNQWPEAAAAQDNRFKDHVISYISQMMRLGAIIMQALTDALHYSPQQFRSYFQPAREDAHAMLRLLHYPVTQANELGVGAHVDSGFIAFLLQDDVGGLQIFDQNKQWIDVPPIDGHFVVNIGEMLQCWSKNCYQATLHRVVNRSSRARYSVPFFFEPNLSTKIISSHQDKAEIYGDYLLKIFERSYPAHA